MQEKFWGSEMKMGCKCDSADLIKKLEALLSGFSLPILLSLDGKIIWINKLFSAFSGYDSSDVKGKSLSLVAPFARLKPGLNLVDLKKKSGGFEKVLWFMGAENDLEFHLIGGPEFVKEVVSLEKKLDPITGVLDRASFVKEVNAKLASYGGDITARFAVLVVDIVAFSEIVSLYGMDIADKLLFALAQRLKKAIRKADVIGRTGGDDFGILIGPISGKEDVYRVVDRIFDALKDPIEVDGVKIKVAVNIGVAVFPDDGTNAHQLLDRVHLVLYKLKAHGSRNDVSFFHPNHMYSVDVVVKIKDLIPKALERKEFMMFYQPIVEMKGGRIIACEALLRWASPDLCFTSPAEFLPIIEKTDLIFDLSLFVVDAVSQTVETWNENGLSVDWVSFNLSPGLFRNPEFLTRMKSVMSSYDGAAERLCLEITESAVFEFEEEALKILLEIKELGCRIAVDDFGTGYSTLKHIVFMPVDFIKVDRFFICGLPENEKDIAVVKTVKALGDSINAEVLAEGVETKDQEKLLLDLGYRYAQGFLYYKPMPKEKFEELISEKN